MTWKRIFSILIFIASFIGGKFAYSALFGESDTVSFEASDWKFQSYLGVQFESPFELSKTELELPVGVKPFVKKFDTYKYDTKALGLFISRAEYKEGIPSDIDGAVQGGIQNMQAGEGVSDFSYEVRPISKNYWEGRRATGTMKFKGKDAEFAFEVYKNNSKLLQIISTNLIYPENSAVIERIMKSMQISFL
ncbi:MAG: hypothetical protein HYS25_15775 [Ignavibacteriales bacterium]|nr:hypothetical protein [Ignavibacteriales bacterium]